MTVLKPTNKITQTGEVMLRVSENSSGSCLPRYHSMDEGVSSIWEAIAKKRVGGIRGSSAEHYEKYTGLKTRFNFSVCFVLSPKAAGGRAQIDWKGQITWEALVLEVIKVQGGVEENYCVNYLKKRENHKDWLITSLRLLKNALSGVPWALPAAPGRTEPLTPASLVERIIPGE